MKLYLLAILPLLLCSCGPIGTTRQQIESGPMKHNKLVTVARIDDNDVLQFYGTWEEHKLGTWEAQRVSCLTTYVLRDGKCVDWTWDATTSAAWNTPKLPKGQ